MRMDNDFRSKLLEGKEIKVIDPKGEYVNLTDNLNSETNGPQRLEDMVNKGIDKQKVLGVLNSLPVIDAMGGESAYVLVEKDKENLDSLNSVGITNEIVNKYGDEETFCILALASGEGIAQVYTHDQLVESVDIEIADYNYITFYKINDLVVMSGEAMNLNKWQSGLTVDERKKLKEFL